MIYKNPGWHKWLVSAFYAMCVFVQAMVIVKIIPYTWVNGGMSASYQAQAAQSVISIVIIGLLWLFCQNMMNPKTAVKKWQMYVLYAFTVFWTIGLVMQLLGTSFERYVMAPLLLFGIVLHLFLIKTFRGRQ